MIEVAISLAIIGFALVAIIGVLPYGMNTQRDNREETVINQDATMLIEAIRNGAYGNDDLTNYVYAITNYWQAFDNQGLPNGGVNTAGYTYLAASYNGTLNSCNLTNGARIIGLLSTPEFIADGLSTNYPAVSSPYFAANIFGAMPMFSNHIIAYVRSISGVAAEKPPQDNPIVQGGAFTYRLYSVNSPMPVETNTYNSSRFAQKLSASQRELRLQFSWPVQPNGAIGGNRQNYRVTIAGQVMPTNYFNYGQWLYFYQPQSFQAQ